MVVIFCVDTTFSTDTWKFISWSFLSLTAMIAFKLLHANILMKYDLASVEIVNTMLSVKLATQSWGWEQWRLQFGSKSVKQIMWPCNLMLITSWHNSVSICQKQTFFNELRTVTNMKMLLHSIFIWCFLTENLLLAGCWLCLGFYCVFTVFLGKQLVVIMM